MIKHADDWGDGLLFHHGFTHIAIALSPNWFESFPVVRRSATSKSSIDLLTEGVGLEVWKSWEIHPKERLQTWKTDVLMWFYYHVGKTMP